MRHFFALPAVVLCLINCGPKVQVTAPPATDVKIGGGVNVAVPAPKTEDEITRYWPFPQKPKMAAHFSHRRFRASPAAKLFEEEFQKKVGDDESATARCMRALFLHVDDVLVGGELRFMDSHAEDTKDAFVVIVKHDGAPELIIECTAAARKEGADGSIFDPNARINNLDEHTSVAMEGTYVVFGTPALVLEALKKPAMALPEVLLNEPADTFFRGEAEAGGILGQLTGTTNSGRSALHLEATSNTVNNALFNQVLPLARMIDSLKPPTLDLTVKVEGSERISAELAFVGDPEQQRGKMRTLFQDVLGLFGGVATARAMAPAEPHDSLQGITSHYHAQVAGQAAYVAASGAARKPTKPFRFTSYPPVPKTIPRGVKVQVDAKDWKAWSGLGFQRVGSQEYQYEIVAAPDGKSAQIIARGDLNGDGKTSKYVQVIKLNPTGGVDLAPNVAETNPGE
jgi:hypothetical protein